MYTNNYAIYNKLNGRQLLVVLLYKKGRNFKMDKKVDSILSEELKERLINKAVERI